MTELQRSLFELQDLKYRDFQSKLLPKTEKEKIIGVRTPILRKFAKEFAQTKEAQKYCMIQKNSPFSELCTYGK